MFQCFPTTHGYGVNFDPRASTRATVHRGPSTAARSRRHLRHDPARPPALGTPAQMPGAARGGSYGLCSATMTAFQSAIIHLVVAVCAIAAAIALAVTGHITGGEAIGVVIAAAGISGTGVAGAIGATTTVTSSPPTTPAAPAVKPAAATTTPGAG